MTAQEREAAAARWLELALASYPNQTSRFLRLEKDPFRNPVGQAFRKGLPALLDSVLDAGDEPRAAEALERIVKIRAVQEFTPSQAVGFVFLLRDVLAGRGLDARIDALALKAFDAYMQCRDRLWEIRAREAAGIPRRR